MIKVYLRLKKENKIQMHSKKMSELKVNHKGQKEKAKAYQVDI